MAAYKQSLPLKRIGEADFITIYMEKVFISCTVWLEIGQIGSLVVFFMPAVVTLWLLLRLYTNPLAVVPYGQHPQSCTADMLRLICTSRSSRLTPSRICPIPAMPEIAALMLEESAGTSTWVTPRTTSITAVRFRPI